MLLVLGYKNVWKGCQFSIWDGFLRKKRHFKQPSRSLLTETNRNYMLLNGFSTISRTEFPSFTASVIPAESNPLMIISASLLKW